MKVITKMVADEIFETTNDNNNTVTMDMRTSEEKTALSPPELILSALAGCAAVDIVGMLKKRRKSILEFVIETDGTRKDETPRYFTRIHCLYTITSPDVTEEELHKSAALALEKYCSVASSLKAEITYSVKVTRSK